MISFNSSHFGQHFWASHSPFVIRHTCLWASGFGMEHRQIFQDLYRSLSKLSFHLDFYPLIGRTLKWYKKADSTKMSYKFDIWHLDQTAFASDRLCLGLGLDPSHSSKLGGSVSCSIFIFWWLSLSRTGRYGRQGWANRSFDEKTPLRWTFSGCRLIFGMCAPVQSFLLAFWAFGSWINKW